MQCWTATRNSAVSIFHMWVCVRFVIFICNNTLLKNYLLLSTVPLRIFNIHGTFPFNKSFEWKKVIYIIKMFFTLRKKKFFLENKKWFFYGFFECLKVYVLNHSFCSPVAFFFSHSYKIKPQNKTKTIILIIF